MRLMDGFQLDFEDALHLAVAIRTGSELMVSNDSDFENTHTKTAF